MSIGEFLAGAAPVQQGIRETQAKMRAARLDQLRMEEANRSQQMVNQLAGEMRAAGLDYKGLPPAERMELEDVPTEKPVAKKPAATALSGGAGTTTVKGGPGADMLEQSLVANQPAYRPISEAIPAGLRDWWNRTPTEKDRLQSEYDVYKRRQASGESFNPTEIDYIRGLESRLSTPTPAAAPAAQQPSTGQAPPTEAEQAELQARRAAEDTTPTAGVTPPEAAAAPTQLTVSPAAPTTPREVVKYEADVAQQPVSERVFTKADFYLLKDPTRISVDMQQVLDQRAELVRYANIMLSSRTAQGVNSALQVKAQINAIDRSLLELQGMQAIREVTMFRDPGRLGAVLSAATGGRIAIQPRTDGKYNVIAAPGTDEAEAIESGLDADALGIYALRQFSATARQKEADDKSALIMKTAEAQIQANRDIAVEGAKAQVKLWADMTLATKNNLKDVYVALINAKGKVDAASVKAAMSRGGIKSFYKDSDGNIFAIGNDGTPFEFTPAMEVEDPRSGDNVMLPSNLTPITMVPVPVQ